ncbi:MAG: ankyrin repeat domain-containing protein [Acidobacteriia bacterium]|nr:ankyrin repeat domain-containing protein [Methyloceanibacter sp.]MCL6491440.1 ankyrin repeat domain-containing protein [Terriglobia bacterium]
MSGRRMARWLSRPAGFAAAAGFLFLAAPAFAQLPNIGPVGGGPMHGGSSGDGGDAKLPPAPALPGAASVEEAVAPPEKPPSELSPNDALFDAIDRGDLAAAREAISRGAMLEARNVLGQTPLDLAIDLGRNQITFLLLSLRGSEGGEAAQPPVSAPAKPEPRVAQRGSGRHQPVQPLPTPENPPTPVLVSDSGGTPVYQAGFLGFSFNAQQARFVDK